MLLDKKVSRALNLIYIIKFDGYSGNVYPRIFSLTWKTLLEKTQENDNEEAKTSNKDGIKRKFNRNQKCIFLWDFLVQCNAVLAITRAVKRSSCDKLYRKLGLEYLHQRRSKGRLYLLCKFILTEQPSHTQSWLPQIRNSHRHPNIFIVFPCRTEYFKNFFSIFL